MNSNTKGNIALGQAIAYFTAELYTISIPLNDCQWYDLIIEKEGIFQTVQVKYTSQKAPSGNYICNLQTTNPVTGKTLYIVTEKPLDLLFCYCENNDMYLIPIKKIKTKSAITLYNKKPNISNKETVDTSNYCLTKKEQKIEKKENIEKIFSINNGIKSVSQYSLKGEFIQTYNNCCEAAKTLFPDYDNKKIYGVATGIARAARGQRKTAYNFQWRY